ncbi:acyltransferase [Coraliomargarita sp. SDUM461004]|uniref:Acyltransferase n=1 Tax=Thalassobacterium sedimentorum TaxID=3041258 RepID=A0ABU1AMN2_9BACT|nr:acyltransferase [Coraliomargarita sp. SDUM461004]MDQ8195934.1 acyltransferase [Coraliomargarita sp. SDUM461004]
MKNSIISLLWMAIRKVIESVFSTIYTPLTKLMFRLNGVEHKSGLRCAGIPKVYVTRRGIVTIGKSFSVNSGSNHNIIGRQGRTILWVEGNLSIGDYVGISNSALICRNRIRIGDHVVIGGNCVIYDTDFHPIDPALRLADSSDIEHAASAPVEIGDNVFIGAHTTVLKGVTIGENSVIGACSLVVKDIPSNEVWAGNPAKCIKKLNHSF